MKYEAIVYFAGPKTRWTGMVDESEIIGRVSTSFHCLARHAARSLHAQLDPSRCGYVIRRGVEVTEHVQATLES